MAKEARYRSGKYCSVARLHRHGESLQSTIPHLGYAAVGL